MCNIAGYTGDRRAAPILIDMLRREQFIDGGFTTGIATIHEGKLYTAKVKGDLDVLVNTTDALNFPGTTGIIHSRPNGNSRFHSHPFVDSNENLALVANGTFRDVKNQEFVDNVLSIMQSFYDRGFNIRSAIEGKNSFPPLSNGCYYHPTEGYALLVGEMMDDGKDIVTASLEALDTVPADDIIVLIHKMLEDTITVSRITRPMFVGLTETESYIATTALAFPEDVKFRNIASLPVTSVSQIKPGEFTVTDAKFKNVRTEEITPMQYAKAYERMEKILKGQKDSPKTLYDFPFFEEWRDLWHKPYVDCKYSVENGLLKPYAELAYQVLWAFHKEGRLHMVEDRTKAPYIKFWID